MDRLSGRVALITGGGSGLGRAIVDGFVAEGARVGVLERDQKRAAALMEEHGDKVECTVGDVIAPGDNERAVQATVAAFGGLHVFVGNAGVYDRRVPIESLSLDEIDVAFDELFAIDVKGYLLGARAAIPALRKAASAAIIFTGSVSSLSAGFGGVLYVAAKHAIAGLTKQLAYELAPRIRVNSVAPGYVPTNLAGLGSVQPVAPTRPPLTAERLPLRQLPTSGDYVSTYVLLASAEGQVMTGSVLLADAGLSIWGPGPLEVAD